jgi:hypothetical protein
MPRECGWCASPNLSDWERRIAAGDAIAAVSIDTPFSTSAARRHVRLHMQPRLRGEMSTPVSSVTLSDFADRLLELADQASAIGEYAISTHNPKLALIAMREERDALVSLMTRLGIESGEAVEAYRDAKALTVSLGRVLRSGSVPDLAPALAHELKQEGFDTFAASVLAADARSIELKGNDL